MSGYLTLTEFIPGTKAKAEEVNANFSTLKDAINTKAAQDGDIAKTFNVANATATTHAVSKGQMDELAEDMVENVNAASDRFCVKSGNTSSGNADLFTYSGMNITLKVGGVYPNLVIANGNGKFSTITSVAVINMTGNANGTYNIFVKPTGEGYVLANTIYKQISRPTMVEGDVWLDMSVEPIKAIKYTGGADVEFLDVVIGKVIIASNTISSIETSRYNQNGYNINACTAKKYDSGWFAVAANTLYTKTHGLGTSNIKYNVLIADNSSGNNQRPALDYFSVSGYALGYAPSTTTSTTLSVKTAAHYVGFATDAATGLSTAYYRILAEEII